MEFQVIVTGPNNREMLSFPVGGITTKAISKEAGKYIARLIAVGAIPRNIRRVEFLENFAIVIDEFAPFLKLKWEDDPYGCIEEGCCG